MPPPDEYTMWIEREKIGKNVGELQKSYDLLIEKVKRIDPLSIAEMTESHYKSNGIPRIVIPFLHSWFVLDLLPYRIRAGHAVIDTLTMKVLVLHHIVAAGENQGSAARVMGQWWGRIWPNPRQRILGVILPWTTTSGWPGHSGGEASPLIWQIRDLCSSFSPGCRWRSSIGPGMKNFPPTARFFTTYQRATTCLPTDWPPLRSSSYSDWQKDESIQSFCCSD